VLLLISSPSARELSNSRAEKRKKRRSVEKRGEAWRSVEKRGEAWRKEILGLGFSNV
jgi:hypothetical protein